MDECRWCEWSHTGVHIKNKHVDHMEPSDTVFCIQKLSVAILGRHSLYSNSKLLKHVSLVLCAEAVRKVLHFVSR